MAFGNSTGLALEFLKMPGEGEEKEGEGKGGGGQTQTNYKYFVHFAAACNYGRGISKYKKIKIRWA